jgi:hypothetical protein
MWGLKMPGPYHLILIARINASAQNIGAPWVQDLISIFNCWERIGVRQEEMEFSKKV